MSRATPERSPRVFTIDCDGAGRYVIYNASEIGNPPDHLPDRWYFRPYPMPLWQGVGEPFDTAEEAERAARARHARGDDGPVPS